MHRKKRFIIGTFIILAALGYIIYGGMQEAMVYFVTPTELRAKKSPAGEKFYRVGGMVEAGSLQMNLQTRTFRFRLTDGVQTIPVYYQGVPPDLFAEGKGAVVEGRLGADGLFRAKTIMAKHAEEYSPPKDGHTDLRSFMPEREQTKR